MIDATDNQIINDASNVSHEISVAAEPVFQVGNFQVTNSLINSFAAVVIILMISVLISRKIKKVPGNIQNIAEIALDEGLKLCDSVTASRQKTMRIFPIIVGLFFFILLNNWMGILPGVGTIGYVADHGGQAAFIPYFRGGTADLNTTLALSLIAVIGANIFGIINVGAWKFFNKFINIKSFFEIPKKVIRDPSIVIVNPIKFFVGIIEIVGELAKVASLSFRLFGNIFAGEVLLASLAVLFAYFLPVPFIFLEIIIGLVQALIFAMLTLVYFTIASEDHEH